MLYSIRGLRTRRRKLAKLYSYLDFIGWFVPLACLVVYYTAFFYYKLSSVYAYGGVEIALPLALILRLLIWTLRFQLRDEDVSFSNGATNSIRGFIGSRFNVGIEKTQLDDKLTTIWNRAGQMLTAVRGYVPGLDEYLSRSRESSGSASFR